MGERFYLAQLKSRGTCPGLPTKTRKRKMAWTDEKRQQAIEMYEERDPTAETSVEIVKEIAEELEESPNGVRMVLSKAGVYIKADGKPSASGAAKGKGTGGTGRVSKEAAQQALVGAIQAAGGPVDEELISKLTGKAAVYFTEVISSLNK